MSADLLIQAQLRPEPRVALGKILLDHGATAAMDLSDGLMGDLPKILAASGVSADIDARRIPVAAAVRALFPDSWLELASRGGEDYELLFTASPTTWAAIEEAAKQARGEVTAIGMIVPLFGDEPLITLIEPDGSRRPVSSGAFDHFASSD